MVRKMLIGLLILGSILVVSRVFAQEPSQSSYVDDKIERMIVDKRLELLRSSFQSDHLDFDAISQKLMAKGYISSDYNINLSFTGLDTEFKSWFPTYNAEDFNRIEGILNSLKNMQEGPSFNNRCTIDKPNIYLYPPKPEQIKVALIFSKGGKVTKSDPEYKNGWSVYVKPDGTYDYDLKQYSYLFYEADAYAKADSLVGYVVNKGDLEGFFRKNMAELGFIDHEINDFTDYWIPLLDKNEKYEIKVLLDEKFGEYVKLDIAPKPDKVLRLIYIIRGVDKNADIKLKPPLIKKLVRKGFTVVEWGVVRQ